MIIPSIDLMNGRAVQLRQGREKVLEREDVFALLDEFSLYGEVALVDLDAAMGRGDNAALIKQLLKRHPCRVGGGIRDLQTARNYLACGASRVIIGTCAGEAWVRELPREAVICAVDARGDVLTTHGWQQDGAALVLDVLPQLAPHCGEFLYTQVEREGLMQGLDRARIEAVLAASPRPVTVAGGVRDLADLQWINARGAHAQIGMSLYSGAIRLDEAWPALLDFDKMSLLPTVVQDVDDGRVLMLAYSSRDSLQQALQQRRGVYHSRSRNALWRKGDTSGHTQVLCRVDFDCDGDALLFQVRQKGAACHLGRASCFARAQAPFSLPELDRVFERRVAEQSAKSYTLKLLGDADLQAEKLREECAELLEASEAEHVRWEAADLLYFTLVSARARGVSGAEILNELRSRRGGR